MLTTSAWAQTEKPNIIFFLADDLGWTDSEVYGSDFYETPSMKRLAEEGMVFEQAYAQPLCSPTRAGILTGKYPGSRLRMHQAITWASKACPEVPETHNPDKKMCYPESRDHLPLQEFTLAEALKGAGYQTWHLGKWHLKPWGKESWGEYDPVNQGFDLQIGVGDAGPGRSYFAPYTVPEFPEGPEGEYITERMAEEACKLIEEKHKEGPFFMYYAEFNVHAPYSAKKNLIDYYVRKSQRMEPGKHRNPVYAAMVHGMDQALGTILDKVDELGIEDNTIIVFVSDNGGISWNNLRERNTEAFEAYEKWLGTAPTSNEPLRGHKHSYYEGGVRVPMMIRWPGQVLPGSKTSTPVHIVDFYPTFLEISGAQVKMDKVLDGESIVPLLKGNKLEQRPLFCHFPRYGFGMEGGSFIRDGDYKLIRIYGDGPDRTDRYELYNLATDIGEKNDLSAKMPEKVKQLAEMLDHWLDETGALMPLKNPDFEFPQAKTFFNPPNKYRITQYQLNPATLKKYPEYGIGGTMAFFYSVIYPESGRENYLLGEQGAGIIGDLVDQAKSLDYSVWLADDWGYPSGMAGGKVVAENPDYEVKSLTMLKLSGIGDTLIEFSIPENLYDIVHTTIYPVKDGWVDLEGGMDLAFEKRKLVFNGLDGDWQLRIYARYLRDKDTQAQSTMKQFGHAGRYPDIMNKEAMGRFIANMHEPILAQIENPAEKVEGFYCNEPNLMQTHWKLNSDAPYPCVPWSNGLPDRFREIHGYELFSILPFLFEGNDKEARRARIHYRQAVAELLTDSFSKQIREWCNAHGIKSSGHFLLNEYLSMHVQGYGDLMKFVSEFDVPALDIPIPNPDEFKDFAYQQTRFFSSVASWKKRDMTIMLLDPIIGGYGLSRLSPDLPLLINSVNMASFHGANFFTSYLPLDARKNKDEQGRSREAKGYTKEVYRFFNEYTGRLTQILQGAQREAGVGLYYPIAMFQADLKASERFWSFIVRDYEERQEMWDQTEKSLLQSDVEYMIIHPEAVAEAEINNGQMKIGYGSYHTIVMPQMDFIPVIVAEQLDRFEKSGGKVLWIDMVPDAAEYAMNDKEVQDLLDNARSISIDEMKGSIDKSYSEDFDLQFNPGNDEINIGRFIKKEKQIYLLVNREQEDIVVEVKGMREDGGNGSIMVLDPSTGKINKILLPARLQMEANRSLVLMPDGEYLKQGLLN